ncbi:MAG: hypothetical protein COA36_00545 [Desulfotalea sp.]|nr:MAG: hypothetical protein COA36_00545 [Desulfotalea sp.]
MNHSTKLPTNSTSHQPTSLERRQDTSYTAISPEWEIKTAISTILTIALKPISFQDQLQEILGVLVSISWLEATNKGAIFVANGKNELILAAVHNLHPKFITLYAKTPFGCCLCGKAAETKKLIYKSYIDDEHDIRFDGMKNFGHYNLPLLDNNNVIQGIAVLYVAKHHKQHPDELLLMEMLSNTLTNSILNRSLKIKAEISSIRMQQAQFDMLHKLLTASEFRDNETGDHIKRMSQYAVSIGQKMGLNQSELKILKLASPIHDIGKVGIPDAILLKPGKLTPEEFAIMKDHTDIGAKILTGTHKLIQASRNIAWTHHERWDGKGYPRGLAGEEIPLFGRISALADVFDALTSKRPYKNAWPVDEAITFIKENSGSHFDTKVVDAFLSIIDEILEIKALYSNPHAVTSVPSSNIFRDRPVSTTVYTWDDSFSIGVASIDAQHQYLINLLNRIHEAVKTGSSTKIVTVLIDMQTYAEVHFADEESIMRENNYPQLNGHILLHKKFISKTESFMDDLELNPLAVSSEIAHYLGNWTANHIQKVDKKFGDFLKKRNLIPPADLKISLVDATSQKVRPDLNSNKN